MKYVLLDLLICPQCEGRFELQVFKKTNKPLKNIGSNIRCKNYCNLNNINLSEKNFNEINCTSCYQQEINEGVLRCKCGKIYPIINSIPRILPNALASFPHFIEKYREFLQPFNISKKELEDFKTKFGQTQKAFELQWEKFGKSNKIYGRTKEQQKQYFFNEFSAPEVMPEYFKDKLVVEGGCGHGTFIEIMAELGAEAIGLDLGMGVEIAYKRCEHLPTAHIIQTNIMNPPIKKGCFDYVFSTGVIHHTPDTMGAFHSLAGLVKSGGYYAIWVYPKESWVWEITCKSIRYITTRLPPGFLYYLCYIPVPLLSVIPAYSGTNLKQNSWRECVQCVYDWFSPKYQSHHTYNEIIEWFEKEQFESIKKMPLPVGVTGIRK